MDLEKFGKLALNLMVSWFLLVAGLGLVISFKNGIFF
jgi:hypothetical protein